MAWHPSTWKRKKKAEKVLEMERFLKIQNNKKPFNISSCFDKSI